MLDTTLAFFDFNAKQQASFSAILVLSERNLDNDWKIVNKDIANVIFVCSQQKINQVQWDKLQLTYPQSILVAYSKNLSELNIAWKLLTELTKPPIRSKLIILLNEIAVELNQIKKPENKTVKKISISKKIIKNALFLPEDYFLGVIQKSIKTGEIYHCQSQSGINLYLYPQQFNYYCSVEITNLKSLFLTHPNEIKVEKIIEIDLKKRVKEMKAKTLNDLCWHSTIIASQGRLMKNHHHDDSVHLKYWPDISYLNTAKDYLAIATFMNRNTVDIKKISQYTEKKEANVIDFHNACDILGLIDDNKNFCLNSLPASDKLRQLRQNVFNALQFSIAS